MTQLIWARGSKPGGHAADVGKVNAGILKAALELSTNPNYAP